MINPSLACPHGSPLLLPTHGELAGFTPLLPTPQLICFCTSGEKQLFS